MGRNKRQQNKKPLQACLSFLSLEERCRSQQSFLVARTLICFQQASSLFPDFQTMSTNHNGWCKMSESNCSACSQNKGATITLHPAYKWHYRSSHACISFLSTLVPTQVGFVIPPNFYQAVDRLFSSFPFNIFAFDAAN